jgi:hypothetical protein
MMQRALTIEDLFQKYQPDKGVPLSSDVIRWANKFGSTIEPEEEAEFRDYYKNLLAQANPQTYLGGESSGGDSQDTGGNHWAQREAELQAGGKLTQAEIEATLRAEQVADRAKIPEVLAKAIIPGLAAIKGLQNFLDPPTISYSKSWSNMTPAEKGYTVDNQAPVTDDMIREAEASDARGNTIAAAMQATRDAAEQAYADQARANAGADGHDSGITGDNSFGGDNADGGGYNEAAGGLISLARGGAVRFNEGGAPGGDDTLEEMASDDRSMVDRVIDTLPDNFFGVPISPDTYKNLGMTGLGYILGIGPLMSKYNQAKYGTKAAINAYDMSMGNMPAFRGYSAPVENRSTYSDDAINEAMDKAIQSGEMAKGTDVDGSAGGDGGGDYSTSSDAYSDAGGVWAKGGLIDKASLALNKPRRTPDHATKSHVVKTKVDGKEKIIRFGQQGASTAGKPKAGESDRMTAKRDSFKARHSANIAKGPSSAAYWANKVKWADGGPVKTHYAEGDSVRATPQNATLGSIANLIKESYSPQRTQQMQGVSKFFDMPALARTVERLSYGEPITNIGKANVPLIPEDTAAAAMLVGPPLGSYAKRVGTNLIQTAPYVARDMLQSMASPLRSYVVKQRGGNWLAGGIEEAVDTLRLAPVLSGDVINNAAGRDLFSEYRKVYDQDATIGLHQWTRKNYPDIYEKALYGDSFGPERAINNWIDKTLYKYIKNDMGTPEDPMRALAERGALHVEPEQLNYRLDAYGKYPQRNQEFLAKSDLAKVWEGAVDNNISTERADKFLDLSDNRNPYAHARLQENPWLSKVPPETQVNQLSEPENLTYDLGFHHMVDEMRNAMDPDSGLPARLMIDPAKLEKMTVPQISERVGQINAWRAANKAEADLAKSMNPATQIVKEYPDQGMRWVELKIPDKRHDVKDMLIQNEGKYSILEPGNKLAWKDPKTGRVLFDSPEKAAEAFSNSKNYSTLEDALKYEGETMGHCVGGYCPEVVSGNTRIYSLRDAKGQPHVTIETQPSRSNSIKSMREGNPTDYKITQIKGKTNRAPKEDYLPFVQDFVKSGQWSDVGDLKNTGLYSAKDVINFMPENFTMSRNARQLAIGRARQAKDMPDYMTKPEYEAMLLKHAPEDIWAAEKAKLATDDDELLRQLRPPEGMARGGPVSLDQLAARYEKGGVVGDSATVYDPLQVDAIIESMITPTNYADDGEVDADAGLTNWLRTVAAKAMSLDTPEMTLGETAADIAAGFVPGVGTAMSARDFERARREDDYLGMALSGAGMIPLVGGMARGVNKARKGENTLEGLFEAYSATDRANAGRKAAELIKSQEQVNASEALGQLMEEGFKKTSTTQADRTRVGGGNIGGAAFSAISEADPAYAGKVWGVMDEGTASRLTNLTTPDTAWTTMLGSSTQLKTNPIVFDKLKRGFLDSMKQGNLPPELAAKINHNLALTFGEGADIRDPKIWREANTFEKRAALADVMMGQGVAPGKGGVALGGEKSGKGVIFKPTDILIKETERGLLHPEHGGDVATFAAGPRMFSLDKTTEYRPDLHPGFPTLIGGRDLRVNVKPTPTEVYLPDWHRDFKAANPSRKGPGYYDLALGVKGQGLPSQALNDEYIRHLIREGYADGGMVGDPVAAYDPLQIDNVMQSMDEPRNYADGGSVSEYDSDRIDAIVNEIM